MAKKYHCMVRNGQLLTPDEYVQTWKSSLLLAMDEGYYVDPRYHLMSDAEIIAENIAEGYCEVVPEGGKVYITPVGTLDYIVYE